MKVELVTKSTGLNRYSDLTVDEIIAAVARHSVIKDDNGKLVRFLIQHAHWSPMEHVHYTFLIETSRGIAMQILRHKSGHFQQTSTRYAKHGEIEPIEFRLSHESNRQSSTEPVGMISPDFHIHPNEASNQKQRDAMYSAAEALIKVQQAYDKLLMSGIARETARNILPIATKTTLHFTANLRDFLSFINVRCDEHAQKEIRDIATLIGEELERLHPRSFSQLDWRKGMFMFVNI